MKQNRSVVRLLSILELLAQHPEGLTLGEIYRTLEMPKATAYDFLQTLYQVDAVYYKDRNLKTYVIGAKMYSIGSSYTRDSNLIAAGTELLQNFAKRYTQTVFITKQNGAKIVYVYKHKDDGAIISVPLSAGSVTTTKENDVVRETYTYFAAKTPHFRHFSGQINNLDYIEAISVPIFNFENKCVGTIVSCDYADKMVAHKDLVNDFINISKIISSKLGYLG